MAINKITRPNFFNAVELQPNAYTVYAQRVGEEGLSQAINISLEGFTGDERVEITRVIDDALQGRIASRGSIG